MPDNVIDMDRLQYYKIDEDGNIVDITTISIARLKKILEYYKI